MNKFWDDYPEQFSKCVTPWIGTECPFCKVLWRDAIHIMVSETWFTENGLAHYGCFEKHLKETFDLLPVGTRVIWNGNAGTIEGYSWYYEPLYTLLLDNTPLVEHNVESSKQQLEHARLEIETGQADVQISSLSWWKSMQSDLEIAKGGMPAYRIRTGVQAKTVTVLEHTPNAT